MSNTESGASPFPETADIETSSDVYARRFSGPSGAWMLHMQEKLTFELIRKEPAATVLDVGGGHGQLAVPLASAGYAVTVLGSAESCRHRVQGILDNPACKFVVGNVIELPFADKSFDLVICFRLLTHCRQWPKLVGELCRVARRRVIADYPTSQSINLIAPSLFGVKKKLEQNVRHWRLFRHSEVIDAFAAHAFIETGRRPQFFFPMVLHRTMRCRPLSAALEGLARATGLTRRWGSPVIARFERSA